MWLAAHRPEDGTAGDGTGEGGAPGDGITEDGTAGG